MENLEIDGFEWDKGNFDKNLKKHGVTTQEIEEVFFNSPLLFSDAKHSNTEKRYIAFGKTNTGRLITIAFTLREKHGLKLLRPISARTMHQKERNLYEETITQT